VCQPAGVLAKGGVPVNKKPACFVFLRQKQAGDFLRMPLLLK